MSRINEMDALLSTNKLNKLLNIEKNSLKPRITNWRIGHYGKDLVR